MRVILYIAILLKLLACTDLLAGQAAQPASPVDVYLVKKKEVYDKVHSAGVIKSLNSQYLIAETSGKIKKIYTYTDGKVKKGELLAEIDNQAEQAAFDSAVASLKLAEIAAERSEKLMKVNAGSVSENDKAQAQLKLAKAAFDNAKDRLEKSKIIAPEDGVVSLELKAEQELVKPGDKIYQFEQLSPLEVEFLLPRRFFKDVKTGNTVIYQVDGGINAEGHIAAVSNVFSLEDESFKVKAIVANPQNLIAPGMFTSIDVICNTQQAITVPVEAIVQTASGMNIYKIVNGVVAIAPVEKSAFFGDEAIISKGVEVADQVIISGQHKLFPGMPVIAVANEQNHEHS